MKHELIVQIIDALFVANYKAKFEDTEKIDFKLSVITEFKNSESKKTYHLSFHLGSEEMPEYNRGNYLKKDFNYKFNDVETMFENILAFINHNETQNSNNNIFSFKR
ncbi:MAG: hypothetical protein GY849_02310 [Deltaproteobacteria bacterium]|nr:hypothetical protein [Deltaproteobacteria bacterium]